MAYILVTKTEFGTQLFRLYEKMVNTEVFEVCKEDKVEIDRTNEGQVLVRFLAQGKSQGSPLYVSETWASDYIEFEEE